MCHSESLRVWIRGPSGFGALTLTTRKMTKVHLISSVVDESFNCHLVVLALGITLVMIVFIFSGILSQIQMFSMLTSLNEGALTRSKCPFILPLSLCLYRAALTEMDVTTTLANRCATPTKWLSSRSNCEFLPSVLIWIYGPHIKDLGLPVRGYTVTHYFTSCFVGVLELAEICSARTCRPRSWHT